MSNEPGHLATPLLAMAEIAYCRQLVFPAPETVYFEALAGAGTAGLNWRSAPAATG